MSQRLVETFSEMPTKQEHFFSEDEFEKISYFQDFKGIVPVKQISAAIKKSKKHFKLVNIKKGTAIYLSGNASNCGYILCHGAVSILLKKSSRQKLENYPNHLCHTPQEKINFLNNKFSIPQMKCQSLFNEFFEEKVLFKYIEYEQMYGEGYFGFSDLTRNTARVYTIIAIEDTIILQIQKNKFEETGLKDMQIKKQQYIVGSLLKNVKDNQDDSTKKHYSSVKQISSKLIQLTNYFWIKKYDKNEKIYSEKDSCGSIYFLLQGEIELQKTFKLDYLKKFEQNQNKSHIDKEIVTKVSRLPGFSYFGEIQYFLNIKNRQFTAVSMGNQTIVIEIEPNSFLKMIAQFPFFEKDFIVSSKQKFSIANENFLSQRKKLMKSFMSDFQQISNKKKEKIINNLLHEDDPHPSNQSTVFEVFSKEGVFYRDTYQKLQGFQQFEQAQANNKRAAIKKYKKQGSQKRLLEEKIESQFGRSKDSQFLNTKQKLFFSPKKHLNFVQILASTPVSPFKQPSRASLKPSRKSLGRFQQLKKDQAVYKRVLIKNGIFEQDKATYKANMARPLVHPKFDDIIKQCMSRKNQVVRKAIGSKQDTFLKDTYQSTIESIKNRSLSVKYSQLTVTCKGTEQLKKTLNSAHNNRNFKRYESFSAFKGKSLQPQQNLQSCLGVNQPPASRYSHLRGDSRYNEDERFRQTTYQESYANDRDEEYGRASTAGQRQKRKQKFVLLNHMMKPMTYSSVQI